MDISACVVVRNVAVSSCNWWRPPGPSAGDKQAKTEVEIGQKLDCSFIFFRLRIPFTFLPTTLHMHIQTNNTIVHLIVQWSYGQLNMIMQSSMIFQLVTMWIAHAKQGR